MWPLIGALASGAMGLIGGMQQNSAAATAADNQMAFQERSIDKQMAFQTDANQKAMDYQTASNREQMAYQTASNERQMEFQKQSAQSQYQWAMDDMRKAGLNPMLAYKQGGAGTLSGASSSGASSSGFTSSGASGSGSNYTPQNAGAAGVAAASSGAATALAAARNDAELKNIAADTLLKSSQDKTQTALQVQAMAQAGQANANSALMTQETLNAFNEEQILRQNISINNPRRIIADHDTKFWSSPAAAPLLMTRRIMESLNPGQIANSAANLIRAGH